MDSYIIIALLALFAGVMLGYTVGVGAGMRAAFKAVRQPPSPLSAVMCFVCAGAILLAAIGTGLYSCYFLFASTPTDATVIEIREKKNSEGDVLEYPIYRYTDAGGTERSDSTSFTGDGALAVGDVIPVRYLRRYPAVSRIDSFTHHWLLSSVLAGGSAVTAMIGAVLYWEYKRQKNSPPEPRPHTVVTGRNQGHPVP